MKFAFAAKHRTIWPVAWLCKALDVSKSGVHDWLNRQPAKRTLENETVLDLIRRSFLEHLAIHRPIQRHGRAYLVMAQACDEGRHPPMAMGHLAHQPAAFAAAAITADHVGGHPVRCAHHRRRSGGGNQAWAGLGAIPAAPPERPASAAGRDPCLAETGALRRRATSSSSAASGTSAIRPHSSASCPGEFERLVTAHPFGLMAPRRLESLHQLDHRAWRDIKPFRGRVARFSILHGVHHPDAKIDRPGPWHGSWPPVQCQR